jgi:hypothetical protein
VSSPSRTQVDAACRKLVGDDLAGFLADEAEANHERAAETAFERQAPELPACVLLIPVRVEPEPVPGRDALRALLPWVAVWLALAVEFAVMVLWRP